MKRCICLFLTLTGLFAAKSEGTAINSGMSLICMLCVFVSEYVLDGILGVFSIRTLIPHSQAG